VSQILSTGVACYQPRVRGFAIPPAQQHDVDDDMKAPEGMDV